MVINIMHIAYYFYFHCIIHIYYFIIFLIDNFDSQLEDTVHHAINCTAAGAWETWVDCIGSQKSGRCGRWCSAGFLCVQRLQQRGWSCCPH